MESDTYLTIRAFSEGVYKEKGSRFLSFAYPASSTDEIKEIVSNIRKLHHAARHHCYAWVLGPERKLSRSNDDGEPSGTAGKPILGQINSYGLTDILVVVTRYFGGKLLGASGLINAYRTAAESAIKNAEVIELAIHDHLEIYFDWQAMNQIMQLINEEDIVQSDHLFDTVCTMKISFKRSRRERVISALERVNNLTYKWQGTK
jgi:uncharacterized YigZ family protein